MKHIKLFEEFLNESLNEELVSKGLFKGFEQLKNKVSIPLGIDPISYNISRVDIPKATVGIGLELNKNFKFPYDYFDIDILKNELCVLVNNKGKSRLKVNIEKGNYTLNDFIGKVKDASIAYLERLNNK
jgi:hypothetical protein